jgi:hypothetical protein
LELCAALAVNVPAFPVYAMESEERTALVAAGTVFMAEEEERVEVVPGSTMEEFFSALEQEEQNDRTARLQDIWEDEMIYEQRERTNRLANLFAYDPTTGAPVAGAPAAQAQAAGPAPVAEQGQVPTEAPVAPEEEGALTSDPNQFTDDELLSMQLDTRFSILEGGPGGVQAGTSTNEDGGQVEAPATEASPSVAQAPQQTTVPVR